MSLEGIDVSAFQATTPPLAGLAFVVVKATEGTGYVNPTYAMHVANARKAGLVVGAYHFGRAGDGAAQARYLLATAPDADFYALDDESDMTADAAHAFVAEMHRHGPVGLYHSLSGFPADAHGADWRWIASWGTTPPPEPWAIWQYQGEPLDRDRFNGDLAALYRLAGKEEPMFDASRLTGALAVHCKPGATLLRDDPDVPTAKIVNWAGGSARMLGTVTAKNGTPMACIASTSWTKQPVLAFLEAAHVTPATHHVTVYDFEQVVAAFDL